MKKKYNKVFQFKITLSEINPSIWRRILVPETYSFWDLHVAIQDSIKGARVRSCQAVEKLLTNCFDIIISA